MTASTAMVLFGIAAAILALYVLFREYPKSATDATRNTLFTLRDELFELGRQGVVPFDSEGYRAARAIINGMIRYAHYISVTQLLIAHALKTDDSRQYNAFVKAQIDAAQATLPDRARAPIQNIMDRASEAMFQLVITRSLLCSVGLGALLIAHIASAALKHVQAGTQAVAGRMSRRSNVEETIVEILDQTPKVRPLIRTEASRYIRDSDSGLCLAAAA